MYYKIEVKHKAIADKNNAPRTRRFYADNDVTMITMMREGLNSKGVVTIREISQAAYVKATHNNY